MQTDVKKYTFKKPESWKSMPLYEKIKYVYPIFASVYLPYTNKLEAKKYVQSKYGHFIKVAKLIRVLKDCNDIHEDDIKPNYLIKSNYDSGYNLNITPTQNNTVEFIKRKVNEFTASFNHYNPNKDRIQSFFIEEKIHCKYNGQSGNALTFLFRCIHGKPYTFTILDKELNQNTHYWIHSDTQIKCMYMDYRKVNQTPLVKEINLNSKIFKKMYDCACVMCLPFEFVRLDFYIDKNENVVFSEYTFFPVSGSINFSEYAETYLGEKWV